MINLEYLNKLITFLANLGVLVGIVFVAVELQQNNEMMRAQIRNELSAAAIDTNQSWQKPELVSLYTRVIHENYQPDLQEERLLDLNIAATFRMWENMHYQNRIGMYDESEIAANRRIWSNAVTGNRMYRDFWIDNRSEFSDAFREEIDAILDL